MALGKTSISLPSLNLHKIHTKFKIYNDALITRRHKFCKTCCKPCIGICPRISRYVTDKTLLKTLQSYRKSDNFILIGVRYITELYQWVKENDFLKSIIASAILFAIGIKLTGEMNDWNLSQTVSLSR